MNNVRKQSRDAIKMCAGGKKKSQCFNKCQANKTGVISVCWFLFWTLSALKIYIPTFKLLKAVDDNDNNISAICSSIQTGLWLWVLTLFLADKLIKIQVIEEERVILILKRVQREQVHSFISEKAVG